MGGLFLAYKLVRYGVRSDTGQAYANARSVIETERRLGWFTQVDLQQFIL